MSAATAPPYFLSWEEFHRDARELAARLRGQSWAGVIGIARGGLIPAAIVARELNIRLIDTLCISSYDHQNQGNIQVLKSVPGDGSGLLLIDDMVDTGNTAQAARALLPKAALAAVYAKPQGMPWAEYYVREFAQEVWVHFPWDSELQYAKPLAQQP